LVYVAKNSSPVFRGKIVKAASGIVVSLVVTGLLFGSGCATLFTSSTVTVQMNSDPPGAKYDIGPFSGKTPDSIAIPKKSIPDFATFEMPGYERRTVPIVSGITGIFWLDILFWPGIIIDMVTGDYKTLDVPEVSASLTPVAPNTTAPAPQGVLAPAPPAPVPAAPTSPAGR
jgi:hypothetical protein